MSVFAKPNERCRACQNIVIARKRTFRGTRKEGMLVGEETPCLNTANPLDKCCNKGKRVANALGAYCLQIAWLDIILSVKFVFLRI